MEKKKQFLCLLAMLAEAFKEDISKERAKIYFEFLKDYEIEEISQAFNRSIAELKFFPKVAELKEFILDAQIKNEPYWPQAKELEWKEDAVSQERAVEILRQIQEKIDSVKPREIKPTLEGAEAEEFERKRLIAKEKAKEILN